MVRGFGHNSDGRLVRGCLVRYPGGVVMSVGTILLILLILILLGAIPRWNHSQDWGYGPSGGIGLIVIIILILVLTGRL